MAVDIPVIIDIEGAFQDAAKRVSSAIKPLERQISKTQLNAQVNVGTSLVPNFRKFKDLLKESQSSATQLQRAISAINAEIQKSSSLGGFNPTKGLKNSERDLLALRAALETKLEGGSYIDNTVESLKKLTSASSVAGKTATSAISSTNSLLSKQGGLLSSIAKKLGVYVSIWSGIRLVRNIREVTAEFEMQKVALAGIIQDTTRANQLFAEVKAAAVQSPFQINDLVSFTKQLSAYRIETENLFNVTMRLADVSAGLGVDMSRLVLAYGQVRAASVLRGQELRQFTEAGIPLVDLLAKKFSTLRNEMVSTGEVFELISERAVPFSMIDEIFNDMTSAGGIFYEMQLKQSETLKGQWMKLKDVISIAYDEMGRGVLMNKTMSSEIKLISSLVKNWRSIASVVDIAIYSYVAYKAAMKGLIPFYNAQQKSIARQIQMEKRQQIEELRLSSTKKSLTAADKARIAQIKKNTSEDYKRIYAMDKMTRSQAMLVYWRNKDNKEITKAIQQTGILTQAEMRSIKKMNALQVRWKTFSSSLRTIGTSIGSAIASFWPIALVSSAISSITDHINATAEQVEAIKKVDRAYHEQEQSLISIENAYRKIQQAIIGVNDEQKRATKEASSFGQKLEIAQKVVEMLKKYGMGGDFDLSLLNTKNIDEFVDIWIKQLNEANELTRDWGRSVAQIANSWEASILGIHLAGDNLKTDIKQLTDQYIKMTTNKKFRQDVNDMRNYLEKLKLTHKDFYDLLSLQLGEEAMLAVAQRRRNETEYQYQRRLLKNYETIRRFAQSDKYMLSGAMKSFVSMNDSMTKFEVKLNEVEREFDKTWGSFEGKDEITIKMAIDKLFAENEWEDWLKEAWIERVNQKYQMNIQVIPTIGKVDIPRGIKGIIATEFESLFTEQELSNMNTVTEIGKAIEEKMSKASASIEDADKLANNFANNELWSEKSRAKIKRAQITIDEELAKNEKDRNQEVIRGAIQQIDAITKQNGLYDEQIVKKKESARAEYDIAKAAMERLRNLNLSGLGKDIKQAFPDLMARNRIIDEMDLKSIGAKMKAEFPKASADLLARPLVDAAELVKKGWKEAGEGIATVYTSTYDVSRHGRSATNLLVTPILPDGSILSPEELDAYVDNIMSSADIFAADTSKLIIGVDVSKDAGERLHQMQESYYNLADKMKNVSNRFLISDDELKNIKDGADAYDIYAKNIKAIEDAREKLADAGVSEQTVAEEQKKIDAQRATILEQIAVIQKEIGEWNYEQAKAEYDSLVYKTQTAKSAKDRAKAEQDIKRFLESTNFDERAILVIEKQRLLSQLGIANSAYAAQVAFKDTFATLDKAQSEWEEFAKRYNLTLFKKPTGGAGQDPWVILIKNRMKFMQDFQRGVEDLDKYMEHSLSLGREQDIMRGRGLSLGINTEDLLGTPQELRDWYDKSIKEVVSRIRKMGGKEFSGLGVTEILAKDLRGRKIQKYQELLAEFWKGLTDFDTNQIKKSIEETFKRISEEIKRSEAARNLFEKSLGLTGDKDIAANLSISVYGEVGKDFRDRIQSQLENALNDIDLSSIDYGDLMEITSAVFNHDFNTILKHLDKFPDAWRERLKEMANDSTKYNEKLINNFADLISKYGSTEQKIETIRLRAQNDIDKVKEALSLSLKDENLTPEQIKNLQDKADAIIKSLEGQRDLDIVKAGDDYIKFFAELNTMTAEQAVTVRKDLRDAYLSAFRAGSISADELRRNLKTIDEQFSKLSEHSSLLTSYLSGGIDALNKKLLDYSANIQVIGSKISSGQALDSGETSFANKMIKMYKSFGDKSALNGISSLSQLMSSGDAETAGNAFSSIGDGMASIASNGPTAVAIIDMIFKAVNGAITGIQEFIDELNRMRSEENKVAEEMKYVSDFNKYVYEGWEKAKAGDVIGSLMNIASSIASITSNVQEDKVKKFNEQIKEQTRLIDDLSYSYSRLQSVENKVFGADYIETFKQKLSALRAQYEAYLEQARLEEEKGKSADSDTIREYKKSARDVADSIKDLQDEIAERFTGTDLASAAKDFASAWLDAYKEFSSTTDAIKEKFEDMIQNMVVESLAAKIVQTQLEPIFKRIKELSEDDMQFSVGDASEVANLAKDSVSSINTGLSNLMTSLQLAGLNVRQIGSGMTGIAKDYAGASEESILGLAAATNTQNFFISQIHADVGAILAKMTEPSTAAAESVETPFIYSAEFMTRLQNIDTNLASLLQRIESVITPKGASTNSHCIAIK